LEIRTNRRRDNGSEGGVKGVIWGTVCLYFYMAISYHENWEYNNRSAHTYILVYADNAIVHVLSARFSWLKGKFTRFIIAKRF
jgi:hypothetical protein